MDLNQVTIPSKDVAIAAKFYQRLGLRLIVEALPRYVRFECPDGNATFSIHQVEKVPESEGVVVYFECEDLDARFRQLHKSGIVFDQIPRDQPWLWREARLKDPDGNRIILYFAGENRKNPPWRIEEKK